MLRLGTVIVLGAGFSAEVGMPLGSALKQEIELILPHESNGDDSVRHAIFWRPEDMKTNADACKAIRQALPLAASIDNLIEHRFSSPAFTHCAKLAIVAAILRRETSSDLFIQRRTTAYRKSPYQTSFAALFRLIVENASANELENAFSRVSFVIFNYDRCWEHFVRQSLIEHSGLNPAEAAHLASKLKVWHPYGRVAPLDWMDEPDPVSFGEALQNVDLRALVGNILTFSESRDSAQDAEIQSAIEEASQLIFLGCAFHDQNLSLIGPARSAASHVAATVYLPPPPDENARPALDVEFITPTANAIAQTLERWRMTTQGPGRFYALEPLTSLQLIAKHGVRWRDPPALLA